jgi:hypothetical protein
MYHRSELHLHSLYVNVGHHGVPAYVGMSVELKNGHDSAFQCLSSGDGINFITYKQRCCMLTLKGGIAMQQSFLFPFCSDTCSYSKVDRLP